MINLSYRFDQNSSSLVIAGMPDVSNGDQDNTIGIIYSWTLKIIGSPLLEGKKEHLDNLMEVIVQYSRSYISGIRKKFISNNKFVTISPDGINHKLQLFSSRKGVEPLEIILDDAELSDLTRCLDLLRFDPRFNIKWNITVDKPFTKKYIYNHLTKSKANFNLFFAFIVFFTSASLLLLIPINNKLELRDAQNTSFIFSKESRLL